MLLPAFFLSSTVCKFLALLIGKVQAIAAQKGNGLNCAISCVSGHSSNCPF